MSRKGFEVGIFHLSRYETALGSFGVILEQFIISESWIWDPLGSFKIAQPSSALNYTFENDWQSDTLITKYNIICDGEYCEGIFCELANINSLGLAGFFIGAMTFGQVKSRPPL